MMLKQPQWDGRDEATSLSHADFGCCLNWTALSSDAPGFIMSAPGGNIKPVIV